MTDRREYQRQYRAAHHREYLEYQRQYRAAHPARARKLARYADLKPVRSVEERHQLLKELHS